MSLGIVRLGSSSWNHVQRLTSFLYSVLCCYLSTVMTRHIYEWNALDAWMIKITRGGPSFSSEYATYRPRDQGQADPRRFSSGSRQLSEPNLARKPRIDPPKQLSKSLQPSKAASPVLAPVVAKAFLLEPEARLALPPARTTRSVRSAQDLRSTAQLVNHPGGAMFNAKMLSELLAKNQHKDLYPRLLSVDPNKPACDLLLTWRQRHVSQRHSARLLYSGKHHGASRSGSASFVGMDGLSRASGEEEAATRLRSEQSEQRQHDCAGKSRDDDHRSRALQHPRPCGAAQDAARSDRQHPTTQETAIQDHDGVARRCTVSIRRAIYKCRHAGAIARSEPILVIVTRLSARLGGRYIVRPVGYIQVT